MALIGCVLDPAPFELTACNNSRLVRFLVLPLAFGDEDKSANVNKTATVIIASILIGIAYSASLFLVLCYYDERTFLIHSLLVYVLDRRSEMLLANLT
jgi:hypothetical protein